MLQGIACKNSRRKVTEGRREIDGDVRMRTAMADTDVLPQEFHIPKWNSSERSQSDLAPQTQYQPGKYSQIWKGWQMLGIWHGLASRLSTQSLNDMNWVHD